MAYITDNAFDAALNYIQDIAVANNADLHICSQEPSTFNEATSTYTLGNETDIVINAPTAGDTSGRKIVVQAISAGSVTGTGTATHWAIVDSDGSELLATGDLDPTQAVTSGNSFSTSAFDIEIPDAVSE